MRSCASSSSTEPDAVNDVLFNAGVLQHVARDEGDGGDGGEGLTELVVPRFDEVFGKLVSVFLGNTEFTSEDKGTFACTCALSGLYAQCPHQLFCRALPWVCRSPDIDLNPYASRAVDRNRKAIFTFRIHGM